MLSVGASCVSQYQLLVGQSPTFTSACMGSQVLHQYSKMVLASCAVLGVACVQ